MEEPKDGRRKVPVHVGLIMDGNRRWARERNLPTLEGHLKGYNKLQHVPDWFFLRGVKVLSVYAFSTENWNREKKEVDYLMNLLARAIEDDLDEFHRKGYKLIFSGRIDELPGKLPELCENAAQKTKSNGSGTINICLNYGGRPELLDAVKKIVKNQLTEEQIHEGIIRKYLYHGELPDPDIIVRTSGEERISGFLLWQAAYSEFLFLKKYWPDFEEMDVINIIDEYNKRERRFGGN
ncbi:di-trans,poly-cis-decaprenylcistransferase [Candidatus Falkowbacteria bacterium CG10_big_fil_rev_8_21_14_0_10_43_10]|uniref:Isoprenyl transferase n=1 Tax=Candidatus Falkowbacteria bacterium CG10_big_fil_rev_8_21_14_0_10_43_10 TaxID=1974567 RepID=A0A2H0V1E3_9BACT|nr:MAG: di-trans,poly-cis-decaprenylcistransferase [Candidatus Falkowbacteria bacterium CG10_big_fil_rev_8_21_14_0_10_43_10]